MRSVDRFAQRSTKLYNGQDVLKNHFLERYPILYTDDSKNYEQIAQYAGQHEFVWIVDKNIQVPRSFPWHFRPQQKHKQFVHLFPYVYKKSQRPKDWNKVQLVPTNYNSKKTLTHSHVCGVYDAYQGKAQFDIFYMGNSNSTEYQKLIKKFPNIIIVHSHAQARTLSTTDMFWLVPDDVTVKDQFKFDYEPDEWSFEYTHVFGNGNSNMQDGIALFPKNYVPTDRELSYRFYANKKSVRIVASVPLPYEKFKFNTYEEYLSALKSSKTEMFWYIPVDVIVDRKFNFNALYQRNTNHVFLNDKTYDGIVLFSKNSPISKKEFESRLIVNKKQHDIIASRPVKYNVFEIDSYEEYLSALETSKTEMFWMTSTNLTANLPDIYFDYSNTYDRKQNHAFIHQVGNQSLYNGVFLCSKHYPLTEQEITHRHPVKRKEWDIVASGPVEYDVFEIDSYDEYLSALETSSTEMFWMTSANITATIPDVYFDHYNDYDRKQNHAFVHQVKDQSLYNGVFLCSKYRRLTEREIEHKHLVNKKEWDIVASGPRPYDQFEIDSYEEYLSALETSKTEMFWMTSTNLTANLPDIYFDYSNTYDRKQNHAFIHQINDKKLYNGVFLCSKYRPLTEREVTHRHPVDRKEWDIVASGPRPYDQFEIDNYNDYEFARRTSKTEMFWMIPPEVTVADDFKFDLYFDHHNIYDRGINHVFKNGKAYDGISLLSTKSNLTKKEIDMRFFTDKKTYETVASNPTPYDIVFISKDEKHANENFKILTTRFPNAHRISNVVGIHQAHIAAAKLCNTDMFWVVDGDAEIIDNFHFDYYVPCYDPDSKKTVHVWKAMNPINNLIYGYGAVKLLPTELTLDMDITKPDMTTSISPLFKSINRVSNITKFNTDEFSTWRSAFRECVKLSSKTIRGQLDEETEFRLNAWCTRGKDKLFGEYCIAGAVAGKLYGSTHANDSEQLSMINDFVWLEQQFKKST